MIFGDYAGAGRTLAKCNSVGFRTIQETLMPHRFIWSFIALAVALGVSHPVSASSDAASPWLQKFHSKTRLVAGKLPNTSGKEQLIVGIHLTLDWGWKTYWRSPGDAGIPPGFRWTGSKNLKSATVLWPAPLRFADPAGNSIGYKGEVVLPVLLEPKDPAKPVDVKLQLDYAICKDICAPAESKMTLAVLPSTAKKSPHLDLISRFMKQVPTKTSQAKGQLPLVKAFAADMASSKPHLSIEAQFAPGAAGTDLFVEGPRELYLPLPKQVATLPDGRIRYHVELDPGAGLKTLKGQELTFTLVSDKGQSETRKRVD